MNGAQVRKESTQGNIQPVVSLAQETQLSFNHMLLIQGFLIAGEKCEGAKSWLKLINTLIFTKAVTFQAQNRMILLSFWWLESFEHFWLVTPSHITPSALGANNASLSNTRCYLQSQGSWPALLTSPRRKPQRGQCKAQESKIPFCFCVLFRALQILSLPRAKNSFPQNPQ